MPFKDLMLEDEMKQVKITNKKHPWFGAIAEILQEDVCTVFGKRSRVKILVPPKGITYGGATPFEGFVEKKDYRII